MIRVHFLAADGAPITTVEAESGARLLEVAQNCGIPLEGTCEGQMACSTCHVIIDAEWFAKLPRAREEEEDMLDLAACATRHSRRACLVNIATCRDDNTANAPPLPFARNIAICRAGVGRTERSPIWSDPEGSSHNEFAPGRSGSYRSADSPSTSA